MQKHLLRTAIQHSTEYYRYLSIAYLDSLMAVKHHRQHWPEPQSWSNGMNCSGHECHWWQWSSLLCRTMLQLHWPLLWSWRRHNETAFYSQNELWGYLLSPAQNDELHCPLVRKVQYWVWRVHLQILTIRGNMISTVSLVSTSPPL